MVIAVSYRPYAEETVQAVDVALEQGARIIAVTDSPVSPIAKSATVTLQVREHEIRGFRTLAASLALAQALVIEVAFEVSPNKGGTSARASRKRNRMAARGR